MFVLGFPLLIIPFALYNILAFIFGTNFTAPFFSLPMLSGLTLPLSIGDLLVAMSILLLYVEILKSTRMSTRAITDHVLSLLLFIAMTGEFMIVQRAGTSTFFLLVVLSFVDVIGGFSVTIRTAQRDLAVDSVDRLAN